MNGAVVAAAAGLLVGLAFAVMVLLPRARRRIERSMALRESRMEIAMGAAKLGTWDWDLKADRMVWSDSLWAVSGLDRKHTVLTRASFIAAIHPDDRVAMQSAIDAALLNDAPFHLEARMLKPDGEVRWMSSHGRVLRDDSGRALRMVGIDMDITALKRAEGELAASEARFRAAFQSAAIGMALVRPEGRWLQVNNALCELLGYSVEEMLATDFQTLTHVDDLPETLNLMRQLHAGSIEQIHQEKRYRMRNGEYRWVRVSVSLVRDRDGQPLYHVTQVLDIEARHRTATALMAAKQLAEYREREKSLLLERLNEAQGVAKIGSWSLDKLSGAVWWSDEMYRIFALDPATYVPSVRTNARYFHPDDRDNYHRHIELALNEGRTFEVEARIVAGDGSVKHINDQGHLEYDANGRLVRVYGTFQDVSERRQLEAQLREAQKMESLGALAGGVAHDFNNLLTVILGNTQLARLQCKDPVLLADKLTHIEQAGQRAKALVDQILAFSRRKPLSFEPVDIGDVAREALRMLRATIPGGVAIVANIPDTLPLVMADATQLHQVVMNLFTNAWHAVRSVQGRKAAVQFDIESQSLSAAVASLLGANLEAGEYLCLSVRDNGIGMDAVTRARIFEPFFTTRDMGEGTGLGLSVVHGIISAHHGAINVESTPGEGTVFRIHLPVARGVTRSAHEAYAASGPLPGKVSGRVLYIDDEPAMTLLVRELVADDDITVTIATDPNRALEQVRSAPGDFDLVVTDFNMPGLSGLDVARQLAELCPTLPVVVSSGYVTPALQEAADNGRIRALVNKVETSDVLPRLVREILASTAHTPGQAAALASPRRQ